MARQSIEPSEGVRGLGLRFEDDNGARFPHVGVFRRSDPFSIAIWIRPEESQNRAVVIHRTRSGLDAASRGYELLLNDLHPEFSLSHYAPGNSIRIRSKVAIPLKAWTHVVASYDGSSRSAGLRLYINGKAVEAEVMSDHLYRDILYRPEWGDYDAVRLQDNIDEEDVALTIAIAPTTRSSRTPRSTISRSSTRRCPPRKPPCWPYLPSRPRSRKSAASWLASGMA
ncbi:LamG domain-containing protein [Verrucomicrobium spinosum]|uniref:LamG domain-containing protein n=1 Tax=Verrucomicrobium spinosum TaxID=2736 RepID=UPI0009467993|nr:LamG domain-containing protein [Verrucomicrobium spinosum]